MPKKPEIFKIDATLDDLVKTTMNINRKQEIKMNHNSENYENYKFTFDEENETIWATQEQIAQIFNTDKSGVSRQINNIITDNELEESSIAKFAIDTPRGKYSVEHYNLDMIIAVGYRINSKKATDFRRWATKVVSQYIKDGYVINEAQLRNDPEKLNLLANKIRELRAEEKNVYYKVKECFRISASDYNKEAPETKNFYALLQDKFHYAITSCTAAKLLLDRADYKEFNMGLKSLKGKYPTSQEAKVAKNYLTKNELNLPFHL